MNVKPIRWLSKKPVIAGLLVCISFMGITAFIAYQLYLVQTSFSPVPFLVVSFLLSIVAGLFAWDKTRQPQKLKKLLEEQTSLLNNAFEFSAIGMAVVSLNGNWMKVNKELCRMLGYTEEELLALPFSKLTHTDDINENLAFLFDAGKGKADTYRVEKRYFHKNGSIVWGNLNSRIVKDDKGRPLHFVAQIEDITERKNAEARIKERESELTAFFENIEGAAALLDTQKKYLLFNSRFIYDHRLLTKQDPYVGQEVYDLFPEEIRRSRLKLLDNVLKGNKEVVEVDYMRDGKRVCYRTSFNPVITNGKVTGISTYSVDLTKSKEAETKIRESGERFRSIIAVSNTGGWEYHRNENFVWCSPEYFMMLGRKLSDYDMSGAENLKETWVDLLHREDRERARHHFAEYLKNGSVGTYENYFRMLHANGNWMWILSRGQTLRDEQGKLTNLTVGTHIDITEHKKAEIIIRENEEKFRMSFMTSQDVFYIGTLDEGRIIDINNSFYDVFGYTREESIGKTTTELNIYAYPEERAGMVAALKTNGNIKDQELTCRKKNGELIIVSATVNAWQMNNEQVIMAVIRDITEKKRIEKELIESEVRFREVLENSLSASYKRNLQTNAYDYLSPVFKKIAGYTQEEMNTMPLEMVIGMMHPDDIQVVTDGITRALNDPNKFENSLEYRFKHKTNGEYRWLKDEFVVMHDALRQPASLIGSVSDTTEQKESELQFKNLVEKSLVGVYIIQKGKFVYVNPKFAQYLDYTPEELLNLENTRQLVYDDDKPDALIQWRKKVDAGIIDDFHIELKHLKKDGGIIWAELYCGETLYKGGKAILGTFQDITERKNTAIKLEQSEEKLRALVENINDGIVMIDESWNVTYQTPSVERIVGYTMADRKGKRANELIHPDDLPVYFELFKKVKASPGVPFQGQYRVMHKQGYFIWIEVFVMNLLDNKSIHSYVIVYRDITERKKFEEQQLLISSIVNSSDDAIISKNLDGIVTSWNKGAEKVFGYKSGEMVGQPFAIVVPADLNGEEEKILKSIRKGLSVEHYETRRQRKDGVLIDVSLTISPIMDSVGKITGASKIFRDITERKRAEESIKQSEANYRQLFDGSPAPMWVIDEKTSAILQVNQACIKNYGYSEEEFLGMAISAISPDEPGVASRKRSVNKLFLGSHRHIKKSGDLIDVITSSIPVTLNGEKSILMTAIDVTEKNLYEQKLMKAAIKAQEDERYEIGGELHDNVCQLLATSVMFLGMIKKHLPEESIEIFDQSNMFINQASDEIRNLSHRLAPVFFDDETLSDALAKLLRNFNAENKYKTTLVLDYMTKRYPLNRDMQLNLYRILQEQLRNILKHAKATQIEVSVKMKNYTNLEMRISDNGTGFDVNAIRGGIGLANMNRRAQLFSGTFTINSAVGKGCEVLVEIPLTGKPITA